MRKPIDHTKLPVYQSKDRILKELRNNQVIIVESPTGSGKTTQLPIILHEAGYDKKGMIGITQPRRIATLSVSQYIAENLGVEIGQDVGYTMRFHDRTSPDTKIKVMTDGILLEELKADKLLMRYQVIMIDEAHERSLNIDFILGLLARIIQFRKDFRVIVSSATINPGIFASYFSGAPIVSIKTPVFPVEEIYLPAESQDMLDIQPQIERAVRTELQDEQSGDILIFLPGEAEIKKCMYGLDEVFGAKLWLLPLYGRLSKEDQERVFDDAPAGRKKVVISTNIAETSVTIDGITSVIDSGLVKLVSYSPATFLSSLHLSRISQASAKQRLGRAGRTQAGRCYRIYDEESLASRSKYTGEEILRSDLAEVLLRMSSIGITQYESFKFLTPPGKALIASARRTLLELGAIDQENFLTPRGEMMIKFPLPPRLACVLVEGIYEAPDVLFELSVAVSFMSTNSPFIFPPGEEKSARAKHRRISDKRSDFHTFLRVFEAFSALETQAEQETFGKEYATDPEILREILNIQEQLSEIISEQGIIVGRGGDLDDYLYCIARGMCQFICRHDRKDIYRSAFLGTVMIHPGSVLSKPRSHQRPGKSGRSHRNARSKDANAAHSYPEFIVAGEIFRTRQTFASAVAPIPASWIESLAPSLSDEARRKKKQTRNERNNREYREQHKNREQRSTTGKGKSSKGSPKPARKSTQTDKAASKSTKSAQAKSSKPSSKPAPKPAKSSKTPTPAKPKKPGKRMRLWRKKSKNS